MKYPKGEVPTVGYYNSKHDPLFVMTRKDDVFFLYEVLAGDKLNKRGKGRDPAALEEKFGVNERITQK